MVFSSIPAYLDPSNWQQQQNHQIIGSSTSANPNLLLPPQVQPPPPPPYGGPGSGSGSIRPGSMTERARMANIPLPETALKCPRCESTNTKFCYFNNYSLTQPRHFCKTCRRYWTRGGALRNVPIGGGCRRNKRSKSSSNSKSPASSGERQTNSVATSSGGGSMLGQLPPMRFMSPLGQLTTESFAGDMGLSNNYSGMTSAPAVGITNEMNFHSNLLGSGGGMGSLLSSDGGGGGGGIDSWRLPQVQQFPFLGGFDTSATGMYQFHGGEPGFMGGGNQMRPKVSSSMLSQPIAPPVKMEESPAELNLSRQLLVGINNQGNQEQWNASPANWNDQLSGFCSSSTSNPL